MQKLSVLYFVAIISVLVFSILSYAYEFNEGDGTPIPDHDIVFFLNKSFDDVGSDISAVEYLKFLLVSTKLSESGGDPSLARLSFKFNDKQWEVAAAGFKRAISAFELYRSGVSFSALVDILNRAKENKVGKTDGAGLLMAALRSYNHPPVDSLDVIDIMKKGRQLRDAGGDGEIVFEHYGIKLNSTKRLKRIIDNREK